MKTTKGRRFVSKYIRDPVKKEPREYTKYTPPKTEKVVLVNMRVPDNSLKNFQFCYFNEVTYGTVIVRDKTEDYNIIDPMDLLNFGKDDMMVLHNNPIRTYGGYDQEAKPFTRVIALAIAHKLYAGAGPHLSKGPIVSINTRANQLSLLCTSLFRLPQD
ncbi:hypothetical protein R6Q57_010047 [Mikania cordata]